MSDPWKDNPEADARRERLEREAVYSASEKLLELLQEHHDFNVPDRRIEQPAPQAVAPVIVPIKVSAPVVAEPVEVCALPIYQPVITVDAIKRVVCLDYGITHDDIISPRRHQKHADPRQVAMYLAKLLTRRSMPEIGRKFGNRDHTTVLHAIRKITQMIADNHPVAERVDNLYRLLTA